MLMLTGWRFWNCSPLWWRCFWDGYFFRNRFRLLAQLSLWDCWLRLSRWLASDSELLNANALTPAFLAKHKLLASQFDGTFHILGFHNCNAGKMVRTGGVEPPRAIAQRIFIPATAFAATRRPECLGSGLSLRHTPACRSLDAARLVSTPSAGAIAPMAWLGIGMKRQLFSFPRI